MIRRDEEESRGSITKHGFLVFPNPERNASHFSLGNEIDCNRSLCASIWTISSTTVEMDERERRRRTQRSKLGLKKSYSS